MDRHAAPKAPPARAATPDDIIQAIEALTAEDTERLEQVAKNRMTRIGRRAASLRTEKDLFQEATERILELNETAVIATRFPESLNSAWEGRKRNPAAFEQELQKWNPVIQFPFDAKHVEDVVREFGQTVDAIEDGVYAPPPVKRLKEVEVGRETFATRVCTNCDVRFSCSHYRRYLKTSRSRDLPRFRDIYEDVGTEAERESRKEAGLGEGQEEA
jgi:hypothetical protein